MPYWFDGNNLIGQSAACASQDPDTRRSFLGRLSQFAAVRGGRFTVYFDGDDTRGILPPKGVRVRYSAPLSTDDAILREAEGTRNPGEVVVVTNDRGLASRCRLAGTKTMDWQAFTKKMSARPPAIVPDRSKEEKVNIEDWSRYFGLDPDHLK